MGLSRSEQMARIRGKDTSPELLLRSALWRRGHRYRVGYRLSTARPDLVFLSSKVAVFIDGCFWHGCPEHYVRPRSRTEFWAGKLAENVFRDHRQTLSLEKIGWKVVRLWEHELFTQLPQVVLRIESVLKGEEQERLPEWRVTKVLPLTEGEEMEQRELVSLRDLSVQMQARQKRSTKKW